MHYDTAKDSSCHDALTGTDVIGARDFSAKAKEGREFAAAAKHGGSVSLGVHFS